jgi:hypothetical protein
MTGFKLAPISFAEGATHNNSGEKRGDCLAGPAKGFLVKNSLIMCGFLIKIGE